MSTPTPTTGVVRPNHNVVHEAHIAIKDDRVASVPGIDGTRAKAVHDGQGQPAVPGVVDAHMQAASPARWPKMPSLKAKPPLWAA